MSPLIWYNSKLLFRYGKLAMSTDCCCAPCSCPYADTSEGPAQLRIVNYQDGDIPAQNCSYTLVPGNIWDGTFPVHPVACEWSRDPTSNVIDSEVELRGAAVTLDTTNCQWELYVIIGDASGNDLPCWIGYKTTGSDPTGTYSFDSGCAGGPSSLEVESY